MASGWFCELKRYGRCEASTFKEDLEPMWESSNGWMEVMLPEGGSAGRAFAAGPYHFDSWQHYAEWRAREWEASWENRANQEAHIPVTEVGGTACRLCGTQADSDYFVEDGKTIPVHVSRDEGVDPDSNAAEITRGYLRATQAVYETSRLSDALPEAPVSES